MTIYTNKHDSELLKLKEKSGKIPFYRDHKFLLGLIILTILFSVFCLPRKQFESLSGLDKAAIYFDCLLILAASFLIFTDQLLHDNLKKAAALIMVAALLFLYYSYANAQWNKLGYLFFNVDVMKGSLPILLKGLLVTIELALGTGIIGTILGLIIAIFRYFDNKVLNMFIIAYVDFFRAMPIIVLMILVYYGLPYTGIRLSAVASGVLALSLNCSAYISEIFRAGFISMKKGQTEAARALGMTFGQTMRFVLVPQALKVVLPPLVSNYVVNAKDTAVCSCIAITELLKASLSEQALLANPSPLIFGAIFYLILIVPITRLSSYLEKKAKEKQRLASVK